MLPKVSGLHWGFWDVSPADKRELLYINTVMRSEHTAASEKNIGKPLEKL